MTSLFGGSIPSTIKTTPGTINVKDYPYSAKGDGVTDDRAAILACFAANPNAHIVFPSGDYRVNNSTGYMEITSFGGKVEFLGKARLVGTSSEQGIIWFNGGAGATIVGLRVDYVTPSTYRNNAKEVIWFTSTTDTTIHDTYVQDGAAAGVLFKECIRPKAFNTTIIFCQADGLHFANCQDPQAVGLSTLSTGDDALAVVNYASLAANTGGVFTNIRIKNSKARGIAIVGQSDVVLTDFVVDGTASSGVLILYDATYNSRVPDNVCVSDGLVKNTGSVTPNSGNQYGVEYSGVTSIALSDIKVVGSKTRGIGGVTAAGGKATIASCTVDSPLAQNGFNISATKLFVDNLVALECPSTGIYITGCTDVVATNLKAFNCSKTDALHRAITFENNTRINASGIHIVDSQATATGYIHGSYGNTSGFINNVQFTIASAAQLPVIENYSYPGVVVGIDYLNESGRLGFRFADFLVGWGTAAPTTLAWKRGDRVYNSTPTVGQPKSWVCTAAGTPGTWVSEGNL